MPEIAMPKLTDSMEEGTIVRWLVADGAHVSDGDELVELESDKATVVHTADADGDLQILALEGSTHPIGAVIARVGDPRESSTARTSAGAHDGHDADKTPSTTTVATAERAAVGAAATALPDPAIAATPLARRIAEVHRLDLATISGTGPRGRITRRDALAAAVASAATDPTESRVPGAAPPAAVPPRPIAPGARLALTSLQRTIVRRMVESRTTVPDFQVQAEVAMDAALALRAQLKAAAPDGAAVPSITDLIVAAAARALRAHPLANGSYVDGEIILHRDIDIGVAVGAPGVLVVPVVRTADTKSLGRIAAETRALAERVRSGTVTPAELEGGTFTVSSLGMYGMTAITPVVNPAQAAILGVGAVRSVLERVDGEIVDAARTTLTLSCDHRILYGTDAAQFLISVRELLEAPLRLAR